MRKPPHLSSLGYLTLTFFIALTLGQQAKAQFDGDAFPAAPETPSANGASGSGVPQQVQQSDAARKELEVRQAELLQRAEMVGNELSANPNPSPEDEQHFEDLKTALAKNKREYEELKPEFNSPDELLNTDEGKELTKQTKELVKTSIQLRGNSSAIKGPELNHYSQTLGNFLQARQKYMERASRAKVEPQLFLDAQDSYLAILGLEGFEDFNSKYTNLLSRSGEPLPQIQNQLASANTYEPKNQNNAPNRSPSSSFEADPSQSGKTNLFKDPDLNRFLDSTTPNIYSNNESTIQNQNSGGNSQSESNSKSSASAISKFTLKNYNLPNYSYKSPHAKNQRKENSLDLPNPHDKTRCAKGDKECQKRNQTTWSAVA